MLQALLSMYRKYADFFEEIGASEEFQKLLDEVDEIHAVADEEHDFLNKLLKIGRIYQMVEDFCKKHHKRLPPTVLTYLKADLADIIEAIPLTP
jgi:hypothetical protein